MKTLIQLTYILIHIRKESEKSGGLKCVKWPSLVISSSYQINNKSHDRTLVVSFDRSKDIEGEKENINN